MALIPPQSDAVVVVVLSSVDVGYPRRPIHGDDGIFTRII